MKKIALVTAMTALSFAHADEAAAVKEQNPHNVSFGPVGFWQHINLDSAKEKNKEAGTKTSTDINSDGYFGGARLGYDHIKKDSIYFGVDGTFAAGRTKDESKTVVKHEETDSKITVAAQSAHRTSLFGNAESRIGYTVGDESYSVSPFVGAGWNYVKTNTKNDTWEDWFYGTAGFKSNFDVNSMFGIGLNAKVRYNFAANAHADDVKIKSEDMDRTWGYELGLPLTWHVGETKNWDVQLEPYFSQLSTKLGDKQAGGRLMFNYKF